MGDFWGLPCPYLGTSVSVSGDFRVRIWGLLVAVSGDFSWPYLGTSVSVSGDFSWPPMGNLACPPSVITAFSRVPAVVTCGHLRDQHLREHPPHLGKLAAGELDLPCSAA